MNEQPRRFRSEKKPPVKGNGDRILNYLIALVVVLIIVVAGFIFSGDGNKNEVKDSPKETVKEQPKDKAKEQDKEKAKENEKDDKSEKVNEEQGVSEQQTVTIENLKKSETAKVTAVNDKIVEEEIEDEEWQPYSTSQKDDGAVHNSSYDQNSVDWQEKVSAIAQITGLAENDMTVWFIKNNGGADSSIGTVSSKDKTKKYRVSLKWISKEGWKPVKVEVLKEINGAY